MLRQWLLRIGIVSLGLVMLVGCGPSRPATNGPGPVVISTPENSATPEPTEAAPTDPPLPTVVAAPEQSSTPVESPAVPATEIPTITAKDVPEASNTPTITPEPMPTATPVEGIDLDNIRVEILPVVGSLDRPLGIAQAGDQSGRIFVLEKAGRIRVIRDDQLWDSPFLDITDRVGSSASEQGLLGLAFHPEYARSGWFFVNYTDNKGDTVVSRFSVSGDPNLADPASERMLLTLEQPAGNHNGGHLAFGPDGYLYIGTGDGGASGDKFGNGQNGATLLGAMLRLDVNGEAGYTIPADNPFVQDPTVRDEIWALGLRNPWRYSFDRISGELYIADVGQNKYEEINVQPASSSGGENYGWPIMESAHCFPEAQDCNREGLVLPVTEYDHSLGCSVTGGEVYHGNVYPVLQNVYVFGDFCSGRIWGMIRDQDLVWQVSELAQVDAQLSSFGQDEDGELYLTDLGSGQLFRIAAYPD